MDGGGEGLNFAPMLLALLFLCDRIEGNSAFWDRFGAITTLKGGLFERYSAMVSAAEARPNCWNDDSSEHQFSCRNRHS